MKKYLFAFFLITISLPLFSQNLNGRIFSEVTKNKIPGVNIKLEGPVSYRLATNDQGKFIFKELVPGRYSLSASRIGYETYTVFLELQSGQLMDLEIPLIESSNSLPEIEVISASRRNTSSLKLPFASSILSRPSQSENIPRSTPESLSIIPGVFVQKTNHGGGSPFIRGLTGNQTLILVDGIRMNNSTFRYGPNQYLNTVDPFSIDKIEVLRGSGSVQYGSDAMGGVIQVFTKDPGFSESNNFKGGVNARYGSGNMERSGSTEFVYSSSKLVFSGVVGLKNFGDLIGGDTTGRQSPSGYTESDASLKLKMKLSEKAELTFANQFVQQKDVDVFHKVRLENFKINKMGVQGRNLSYVKFRMEGPSPLFKEINITGSLNNTIEERNSLKNASLITGLERDKVSSSNLAVELFSDLTKYWTVNSGLEYYRDKVNSIRNNINNQSGSLTMLRGLYPNNSSYLNTSLYSLHHLELGGFNAEAGLRYNWLKASIFDNDLGQLEVSPGAFVWNTGLNYTLKNHHLYVSLNSGYRAPNIDDMGTLGIVDFRYELPSYSLKPEKSYNSELGYKYAFGSLSLGAALYRNKMIDLITRVQTAQIIDGYKVYKKENTEEALIKGVEGFLEWQANRNLSVDMFASFNHGQNLSKSEPLRRVPPFNGNISMKYKLTRLYVKGELAWADKQDRLAQGDRDDNRIPFNGTPGWKVLNIYSGYTFGKAHLRLSAQNLFNVDYRTHGSGINAVGRSLWMNVQYDL
ncbi:hemoglobin/transferrin/lactoferrin receptor protein [Daejeonella rubra]|uniref:Hemoglobin/transferrin/lactoferrin receptor protein n=1 Tax=Daejeonella rubra TaxID=990371 RepID=A0A1G9WJT4_9SPHI|nr:TonB-dependent receptor [Daejeonella rubra]SDM84305.1 hemoglobin/transferrin/lactoferrin receptor protein [Daejeonella rubra]